MIRINLLPREDIPVQRSWKLPELSSFAPLVLVVIATGVMATMGLYQSQKVASMEDAISMAEAESRRLAPQIAKIKRLDQQRASLNQRLEVISALDSDRYFRIHIMDELNRALPEHLWLTRCEEVGGGTYGIEGVTFSNFLVSDLIQNLNRSPFFTGVNLQIAERGKIDKVNVVKFKIQTSTVRGSAHTMYGG